MKWVIRKKVKESQRALVTSFHLPPWFSALGILESPPATLETSKAWPHSRWTVSRPYHAPSGPRTTSYSVND